MNIGTDVALLTASMTAFLLSLTLILLVIDK